MDNDLTIQLRVLAAGLDKVDQATKSVNNLDNAVNKASTGGFSKFSKVMESTGSRINVLGQRIMFMAGLPLLALGNSAINTAVDIERSFTRLNKVFSGTAEEFDQLKKAAFTLSTTFGQPVEAMTEVLTEFNKAGVQSVADLESLGKTTAQTAILFDTDMTKALTGVKSVMMGYNLTAAETERALAAINIIGDKTTASEQGILDVMNRAAGTARQAGFSFRELAASQGVFEKSAIPAGRAGNAMKSILVALTKQSDLAKGQFKDLGIDMSSTAWRTADAGDKLDILAKKLLEIKTSGDKLKLSDLNEAMASLVGKFQINNLNVLLEDMAMQFDNNADTVSMFGEGLAVSADEVGNMKWQVQQLDKALESSPVKLDILEQKYRAQAYILGKELIPAKVKLMEILIRVFEWFNKLSPETQKWIGIAAGAVIVLGPLLAALGLVVSSLGFLFSSLSVVGSAFMAIISVISAPILIFIALAAAIGALYLAWTTNFMGIQEKTYTVLTAISGFFTDIWGKIVDYLQNKLVYDIGFALGYMLGLFITWPLRVADAVRNLGSFVWTSALVPAFNYVSANIGKWIDSIVSFFSGLPKRIGDALTALGPKLYDAFKNAFGYLADKWDELTGGFGDGIEKAFKKAGFATGGVVGNYKAKGGTVYAANGFVPRGTDTVPAMLTPGEMVLTKGQQGELFRMLQGRSGAGANDGGTIVEINVGTMIASRGEQRQFARLIQELMDENSHRFVTQ